VLLLFAIIKSAANLGPWETWSQWALVAGAAQFGLPLYWASRIGASPCWSSKWEFDRGRELLPTRRTLSPVDVLRAPGNI